MSGTGGKRAAPLKVAISGPFSTGKTTLVQALGASIEAEGKAIAIVGDVARDAPMSLHRNQTVNASAWLIGTQISRESEAMRSGAEVVLCDRTVLDVLSHTLLIDDPSSDLDRRLRPLVWDISRIWAATYDLVMTTAVDPGAPPAADGLRVADAAYREDLDRSLSQVFERLGMDRQDLPIVPDRALDRALALLRSLG